MSRRFFFCFSAVSAVLLFSGSIQISSVRLDTLEVGDVSVPGRWKAGSPTVQSNAGEYLAYAVAGKTPRVYFTKEKGTHTSWAFVELKKYSKHSLTNDPARNRSLSVDESGFTLRLRATTGPFQGWYLSRNMKKELVLVKKPDGAAVVRFRLTRKKSTFR